MIFCFAFWYYVCFCNFCTSYYSRHIYNINIIYKRSGFVTSSERLPHLYGCEDDDADVTTFTFNSHRKRMKGSKILTTTPKGQKGRKPIIRDRCVSCFAKPQNKQLNVGRVLKQRRIRFSAKQPPGRTKASLECTSHVWLTIWTRQINTHAYATISHTNTH